MRLRKPLLIFLLGLPLLLLAWEIYAVARALARTPEVLAQVSRREVPLAAVPESANRMEALVAGRCRPRGLRDVWYEDCPGAG